ncbi:hypothetical protein [Cytobacillus purgationiresistens]|uniref:Uncharacterized protein n=1 Tax=Cytobacillus purgationiresistens TaxID=863449 RepID=A0ABU0ANN7_9BACI|nr:hypothetical protein [Cytobacillus purgationiresistens]MDQ0272904.1 hypothetical protein [Cytobacillus purgationiresistens]
MNISNKLVDYTIVYDDRKEINSGKYEHKRIIIDEVKNAFKKDVENRTGTDVIIVYDWRKTHSGMEILLYAFEN